MRRDWIAGLVLLGVAVGYYVLATDIPKSQLSDAVGAASFPKLLSIVLAILSALLVVSGLVRQNRVRTPAISRENAAERRAKERTEFLRAGGTLLLGLGFLLIVFWVGYLIAVMLLLTAMLLYNHMKFGLNTLVFAVAGGAFFWALFRFVFSIPVPRGIWPKIFGI